MRRHVRFELEVRLELLRTVLTQIAVVNDDADILVLTVRRLAHGHLQDIITALSKLPMITQVCADFCCYTRRSESFIQDSSAKYHLRSGVYGVS